jgi:hypothetical protein
MRRLVVGSSLLIAMIAFGQNRRSTNSGGWGMHSANGGCVGGSACKERSLRIPLEDRPVIAVQFNAHDQIGERAGGKLRVKIDGEVVGDSIDIPRKGETFHLQVAELQGRYLIFEPATDDEVEISDVVVKYGSARPGSRRSERAPPGSDGGWRSYPRSGGCIGGDGCRRNGKQIMIALDNSPVLGIRFYAHDAVGQSANGRLKVRIDGEVIDPFLEVKHAGKLHELEVDNLHGSTLVLETATDDEVEIKDIAVLYKRAERDEAGEGSTRSNSRAVTDEGKCIGGNECGGRNAQIRIPIQGRPVNNIRFNASSSRGPARLRIRIDSEVLEEQLDVPSSAGTLHVDGRRINGDYVIIEAASDYAVNVKHVRVQFEQD